jgi:vacuolar-type H+-ATPase subunit I/STV1
MFGGFNRWSLGMDKPEAVEKVKEEIKEEKKVITKEKQKVKKEEKKIEKEKENLVKEEENKKLQEKEKATGLMEIKCAAISKGGDRCRKKIVPGKSYCTVHEKVKQNITGKKSRCKKMKQVTKSRTERCGMMTSNKSGYCYYHD